MDVIYQGETWRRQITITDTAGEPVDPDQLVAVLCPEWPITITGPTEPGIYNVALDHTTTAILPANLTTHWELLAVIGSDRQFLLRPDITVAPTCARIEEP